MKIMLSISEENLKNFNEKIYHSIETTYPEEVSIRASYVTHIFKEILEEIDPQIFFEEICLIFIEDFIEGGDYILTMDSLENAQIKSSIKTALKLLKEEGLIDSVENETGDEIIFLTKEGQDYTNEQHSKEN